MTPFYAGMSVVCINDAWGDTPTPIYKISKGDILKIDEIDSSLPSSGYVWLHFVGFWGQGHRCDYFRPAHENRMDELRQLLAPVPSKAKRVEA